MIGYVTLGTNDLSKSTAYYDAQLSEFGAKRFMSSDRFVAWSAGPGQPGLVGALLHDGKPATVGNGVMVALAVNSADKVDTIYRRALELGGTDEGKPGERMDGFYAAYFRDLDGNKLNCFYMGK